MEGVSLIVMYDNDSMDIHLANGCRLCLAPCGSEFMIVKALASGAHPLQKEERVRQRTRFVTSEYKDLLTAALRFRNKYAEYPYVPAELLVSGNNHLKSVSTNSPSVEWSAETSPKISQDKEVVLTSLDGNGKLILSSCGEEFFVEVCCRVSPMEPITTAVPSPKVADLISEHDTFNKELQAEAKESLASGDEAKSLTERTKNSCLFTTIVQHHSCFRYPANWRYPLSLAVDYWRTLGKETGKEEGVPKLKDTYGNKSCPSPGTDAAPQMMSSSLLEPLPLRCPAPHMHRWSADAASPLDEHSCESMGTDLLKVFWCQGILYRILSGTVPVIEICPGDGTVIRSNGILANYFTHHKAGHECGDKSESTYCVSSLPPDLPGQTYSVSSAVTRASRLLECYNQAKNSIRVANVNNCWKKDVSTPEPLKLLQEAYIPNWGRFLAFSDGSVDVMFLDGVRVHTLWNANTDHTDSQVPKPKSALVSPDVSEACGWCELTLPNGQKLLLKRETSGPYQKYVSVSGEWCSWVLQTRGNPPLHCYPESSVPQDYSKPTQNSSVVAELEKIKRFNFLLESSPRLRLPRGSRGAGPAAQGSPSSSSCTMDQRRVTEALQRTSRAIRDIESLLSHRESTSSEGS